MEGVMPKFIDFAELKESADIVDIAKRLGLELEERGEQLRGECPACGGGGRSLVITHGKGFYCFQKRRGGDVIALVAHVLGLPMKEAAAWIVGDSTVQGDSTSSTEQYSSENSTVPGNSTGMEPLGYLKTDHEALFALGLSPETLEFFGAGYATRGILRGRLCIPIHDPAGEILLGYCGRAVSEDQEPLLAFPKNLDPRTVLFNIHRMRAGELYSTNDPLDVLLYFEGTGETNMFSFLHRPIVDNVVSLDTKRA